MATPLDDPILRRSFSNLLGVPAHSPVMTVKDGLAYVQTHELHRAIPELAATGPVTLITHGSDMTADDRLADLIPPNVVAWHSMNCATDRAHPLPIGLRIDSHDDELLATLRRVSCEPKGDRLAYLCCTWDTPNLPECARVERRKLYERFGGESWVTAKGGQTMGDVPFAEYCADLRASRFAFCPRGAGRDSHRAWEAMYLGCIPILRHDPVMDRFDIPCVRVWDWSQVTSELLQSEYSRLSVRLAECIEPFTASYWTKQILA